MRRRISQAEARRLKQRVASLESQREAERATYSSAAPGLHLGRVTMSKDWFWGACKTARRLGFAIIVKVEESGEFNFYAVR